MLKVKYGGSDFLKGFFKMTLKMITNYFANFPLLLLFIYCMSHYLLLNLDYTV
jgi:hypothetical protein